MFNISVGESRPKSFKLFSRLTEWFEGVDHSHVFISWEDQFKHRWVAEARGGGARMLSAKEFMRDNYLVSVYSYPCDEKGMERLSEYAWENMGRRYGFLQIYGLFEMRLLNKVYRAMGMNNRAINRFVDGQESQICVEFAIKSVQAATETTQKEKPLSIPESSKTEQWGLIEMRKFNESNGDKLDQFIVDLINKNN